MARRGFSFSVKGDREIINKLKALQKQMRTKMKQALYRRANAIMARSKKEFIPVDAGVLKNSGFVEQPKENLGNISINLGFGGSAAAYALAIHEHPSSASPPSWEGVNVQFHPRGRGPKYLEKPMLEAVDTLAKDIAKDLRLS